MRLAASAYAAHSVLSLLIVGCSKATPPATREEPSRDAAVAMPDAASEKAKAVESVSDTDSAKELAGLERDLARDARYGAVWSKPVELTKFLTALSTVQENRVAPTGIAYAAEGMFQTVTSLHDIFALTGKYPDDFVAKASAHLAKVKGQPRLGVWTPYKTTKVHDFTVLAVSLRPNDAGYLREYVAAKHDTRPREWATKDTQDRWQVEERIALERLKTLTKLTNAEEARLASLVAAEKAEEDVLARQTATAYAASVPQFLARGWTPSPASEQVLLSGTFKKLKWTEDTASVAFSEAEAPFELLRKEWPKASQLVPGQPVKILCNRSVLNRAASETRVWGCRVR